MNPLSNVNILTIFLTNKCNLSCSYCWENHKCDGYIDDELFAKIINDYISNGVSSKTLCLYGGEPTLNISALRSLVNYGEKLNNISVYITTNLVCLDDELVNIFKRLSNLVNLHITVSVDVFKPIHDIHRCKSFDLVMRNVSILKKEGLKVAFNTVVTNELLEYIISHKIEEIEFPYIDDMTFNQLTKSNEIDAFYDEMLLDKFLKIRYTSDGTRNKVITKIYDALFGRFVSPENYFKLCSAGVSDLTILSNGNVVSCVKECNFDKGVSYIELPYTTLNVFKNSLGTSGEYVSEYTNEKCSNCEIRDTCIICEGLNKQWTGDKNIVPSWFCEVNLKMYTIWAKHYYKYLEMIAYYLNEEISKQQDMRLDIYDKILDQGV